MKTRMLLLLAILSVCACHTVCGADTVVFPKGSAWRYVLGTNEAPSNWRAASFDDTGWSDGPTPLGYSDATTGIEATIATRLPTGTAANYTTVYLRKHFVVSNVQSVMQLQLDVVADDGFAVWLNGSELGRWNAPAGPIPFNGTATFATEPTETNIVNYTNPRELLIPGTNVIAIHLLNSSTVSSDIFWDASLTLRHDIEPPYVLQALPMPGSTVRSLEAVNVLFSEPVGGVEVTDLLVNGVPASEMVIGGPTNYGPVDFTFLFPSPGTGRVDVTWADNHGITDLSPLRLPFAGWGWGYAVEPAIPLPLFHITEFMALNRETLNDEDGDSSDWIEIHNSDEVSGSLGGWFLTDDPANLTRWQFPSGASIDARGYLVVFASGKNKRSPGGRLHTNFRLDISGEFLALVDPQTNIVSQFSPTFPPQFQDVSYGRDRIDPSITGFFATPTPGAPNSVNGTGFGPEVDFSHPSGTFRMNAPFLLALSAPGSNTMIRYELGTNAPRTNSLVYSTPLLITNTTLVRARAFQPGVLPGPISARTYLALSNDASVLNFNSHLPIIVLHNYGQGPLPLNKAARTLLMQVFEPDEENASFTDFPTLAERGTFHLRGDATLGYQKGSFTIEIQDEFGDDKDVELLGLPAESDWLLIAPNNFEPGIINNPLAYQLARDLGQYAPRTRLVEVYLKDDMGAPGAIGAADYNGIYMLMEKIKRNPNRVDIDKLEREHVNEPEITGGYLFSIDRQISGEPPLTTTGVTMNWVEPNPLEMTNASRSPQVSYIRNYFNDFNAALNSPDAADPAPAWATYIDSYSWVTRHIHEVLTFNVDALRLSTFFYKPRNEPLKFGPAFDYDRSQGSSADGRPFNPRTWRARSGDLGTDFFNMSVWWSRMFRAPDFWQQWIDRYQELRDGPLSMHNINSHIDRFASEVRPAHAREVARWNIQPRSGTVTMDGFSHNFGTNGYENEVRWYSVWYSNRLHFMDTQFLARPFLGRYSGPVTPGEVVTLYTTNKPGTYILYTLDGTDPRLPGGAVASGVYSNDGLVSITISNNVHIAARSWNPTHRNLTGPNNPPLSTPWSGLTSATLYTEVPPLRITEIMYHPDGSDLAEYVEVKNIGGASLNLAGFTIGGGIDFTFPPVQLEPGDAAVVAADLAAFQARYGSQPLVVGIYTKRLDNSGDQLVLRGPLQEPILDFRYEDDWYPITDGAGFSLVAVNEQAEVSAWSSKSQWRPSGAFHGLPGESDPQPPQFPHVVVRDVLPYPSPGQVGGILVHNFSLELADISGWYLTDDFDQPKKFRIPQDTVIRSYHVNPSTFSLNTLGEEVYLFSADAVGNLSGYVHGFQFGAAAQGISFGRYVISTGEEQFPAMYPQSVTPVASPVVISEIHYHPPDFNLAGRFIDNAADEFIELHNRSAASVALNGWRLTSAVEFQFPDTVLASGDYLVLVPFDPAHTARLADFRSRFGVPASVPVLGPYYSKLDNVSASVDLMRPDPPRPTGAGGAQVVPYILVDRVHYSDRMPWPGAADGLGPSLQRRIASHYGNEPTNWVAAALSPGGPYSGGQLPAITAHPQDQTALATTEATFSVGAQGAGLRYQWLFNSSIISNATNSILQLSNVQYSQAGDYSVAIMNAAGAIMSDPAQLIVLVPATIHSHPQSATVRPGVSLSFTITATSTSPLRYQWLFNGQEIPGAINRIYQLASVEPDDGGTYRVRLTDDIGSILSQPAVLRVLVDPIVVQPPVGQTVPFGASVTLSVALTNIATLPIEYRWRIAGRNIQTNISSQRIDFFSFSNIVGISNVAVGVINEARVGGILSPTAAVVPIADSDEDGMPDEWEDAHGFERNDPNDLDDDPDGDTMRNVDEYISGTDPNDALSYLRVKIVSVAPSLMQAHLEFHAVSNRTYAIDYRTQLRVGSWQRLTDIIATPTNHIVEITDGDAGPPTRFYRLVTPRVPRLGP